MTLNLSDPAFLTVCAGSPTIDFSIDNSVNYIQGPVSGSVNNRPTILNYNYTGIIAPGASALTPMTLGFP